MSRERQPRKEYPTSGTSSERTSLQAGQLDKRRVDECARLFVLRATRSPDIDQSEVYSQLQEKLASLNPHEREEVGRLFVVQSLDSPDPAGMLMQRGVPEFTLSDEMQSRVRALITESLRANDFNSAVQIVERYKIDLNEGLQRAAYDALLQKLKNTSYNEFWLEQGVQGNWLELVITAFDLSVADTECQQIIQGYCVERYILKRGDSYAIRVMESLASSCNITLEGIYREAEAVIRSRALDKLSPYQYTTGYLEEFGVVVDDDFKKDARDRVLAVIKGGSFDLQYHDLLKEYEIEIDAELKEAIVQRMKTQAKELDLKECVITAEVWAIPVSDIQGVVQQALEKELQAQNSTHSRGDYAQWLAGRSPEYRFVIQAAVQSSVADQLLRTVANAHGRSEISAVSTRRLLTDFGISENEFANLGRGIWERLLRQGSIRTADDVYRTYGVEVEGTDNELIRAAVIHNLISGNFYEGLYGITTCGVEIDAEILSLARHAFVRLLGTETNAHLVRQAYEAFQFEIDDEITVAAYSAIYGALSRGDHFFAEACRSLFVLPWRPEMEEYAHEGLSALLRQGAFPRAEEYAGKMHLRLSDFGREAREGFFVAGEGGKLSSVLNYLPLFYFTRDDFKGTPLEIYFDDVPTIIKVAHETYSASFSPADQRARLSHRLSPSDYRMYKTWYTQHDPSFDTENGVPPMEPELVVEFLRNEKLEDDLIESFEHLVERIGHRGALDYMNRPDASFHQTLHFMGQFLDFAEREGASDQQMRNLLLQIARDTSMHVIPGEDENHSLDSYRYFAFVVDILSHRDIHKDMARVAGETGSLREFQELATQFSEPGAIFASWTGLRKALDLIRILERRDFFETVANAPKRLARYATRLGTHGNISLASVESFVSRPSEFFDASDKHTPYKIHEVKKPTNYITAPYLGARAEDLRDALVEGTLDRLQTLPPHEKFFYYGTPSADDLLPDHSSGLRYALEKALGRQRLGIPGEARNAQALFGMIRKWCGKNSLSIELLMREKEGEEALVEISREQRADLHNIIFSEAGLQRQKSDFVMYRGVLGKKSDPEMVVAGNDTASCMPFGSGKNNVYMTNPNCAQFVMQRWNGREWRTVTQSVMTVDMTTVRPVSELMMQYTDDEKSILEIIEKDDLKCIPVVTCDNIQPSKNQLDRSAPHIKDVYRQFFTDYLRVYAPILGVDPTRVIVGKGYTPREIELPNVRNHFVPVAPLGYSDNIQDDAYELTVRDAPLNDEEQNRIREIRWRSGISQMEIHDTFAVATLEGKVYNGAKGVPMLNLHGIQNRIIGIQIANEHFGRPNFLTIERNREHLPTGYVIAYEGKIQDLPVVYFDDLAVDQERGLASARTASRLLGRFMEVYMNAYSSAPGAVLPPIFGNMRDSTSYRLVQNQIHRLAQENGLTVRLEEIEARKVGDELFHDVLIAFGENETQASEIAVRYRELLTQKLETLDEREW